MVVAATAVVDPEEGEALVAEVVGEDVSERNENRN
jgi:hypothetical protein